MPFPTSRFSACKIWQIIWKLFIVRTSQVFFFNISILDVKHRVMYARRCWFFIEMNFEWLSHNARLIWIVCMSYNFSAWVSLKYGEKLLHSSYTCRISIRMKEEKEPWWIINWRMKSVEMRCDEENKSKIEIFNHKSGCFRRAMCRRVRKKEHR